LPSASIFRVGVDGVCDSACVTPVNEHSIQAASTHHKPPGTDRPHSTFWEIMPKSIPCASADVAGNSQRRNNFLVRSDEHSIICPERTSHSLRIARIGSILATRNVGNSDAALCDQCQQPSPQTHRLRESAVVVSPTWRIPRTASDGTSRSRPLCQSGVSTNRFTTFHGICDGFTECCYRRAVGSARFGLTRPCVRGMCG